MNQASDPVVSISAQMAKLQAHHDKLRALQSELTAWTEAGKNEAEDALASGNLSGVSTAAEHVRPQVTHLLGDIQQCAASMLSSIDGIVATAAKEQVPLDAADDLAELRVTVASLAQG